MKTQFGDLVQAIESDVMNVKFDSRSFDIVIIYDATQHFDEKETVLLVQRALGWLKEGGRMLIGGVPDELKKWDYINKPEYHKDYIQRLLNDTPKIGSWYNPRFFEALAGYFNNISVKVMDQPSYQNNADHRFDVLIEKE
jgi:ubiquinone/menaquinone biosynthesis C-methylase UbiE